MENRKTSRKPNTKSDHQPIDRFFSKGEELPSTMTNQVPGERVTMRNKDIALWEPCTVFIALSGVANGRMDIDLLHMVQKLTFQPRTLVNDPTKHILEEDLRRIYKLNNSDDAPYCVNKFRSVAAHYYDKAKSSSRSNEDNSPFSKPISPSYATGSTSGIEEETYQLSPDSKSWMPRKRILGGGNLPLWQNTHSQSNR